MIGSLRARLRQVLGAPVMGTRRSDPEKLYRDLSQTTDVAFRL
jgi:hypothetical protein